MLKNKTFMTEIGKGAGIKNINNLYGHTKIKEFQDEDAKLEEKLEKKRIREERKISKALSTNDKKLAKETLNCLQF